MLIESLRIEDKKVARDLAGDINLEVEHQPIRAKFEPCHGVHDFHKLIADLTTRTKANTVLPLLHIECHGDEDEGLLFGDDSVLSWPALWDMLRPLNVSMGNRLVVVLATCSAFPSITAVPLSIPAPCYLLIAPTKRIWPDELYSAFKEFYCLLSDGEAGKAMTALTSRRYTEGNMKSVPAGEWFSMLMNGYLQEHGDAKGLKASALRLAKMAKADGRTDRCLGDWKRFVKNTLSQRLHQYFDVFFMLDKFPTARLRFCREQTELERILEQLGYPGAARSQRSNYAEK